MATMQLLAWVLHGDHQVTFAWLGPLRVLSSCHIAYPSQGWFASIKTKKISLPRSLVVGTADVQDHIGATDEFAAMTGNVAHSTRCCKKKALLVQKVSIAKSHAGQPAAAAASPTRTC